MMSTLAYPTLESDAKRIRFRDFNGENFTEKYAIGFHSWRFDIFSRSKVNFALSTGNFS